MKKQLPRKELGLTPENTTLENHGRARKIIATKDDTTIIGGAGSQQDIDAQTEKYGDLIELGIIDPAKVARSALQNAASVAGLMITTAAMIAILPETEEKMPSMEGGI